MSNSEPQLQQGFVCTLQRMIGKLEKYLHHQKSIKTAAPAAIEMAIDPVGYYWSESADGSNNQPIILDSPSTPWDEFDSLDEGAGCSQLAELIERALKDAKSGPLHCSEMLIPMDLTSRVARDMAQLAEKEPCGLRGCVLLLNYQDQVDERRIGRLQYDPSTVPTFELLLTLKKEVNGWLNLRYLLPFRGCFRKLGKGPTIIISHSYTLVKRKLYRSS